MNLFHLVLEIFRVFEYHTQNLNTPQNNSASWDLQVGFNSAFKGLNGHRNMWKHCTTCKINKFLDLYLYNIHIKKTEKL
jgi:hypothetical protein